LSLKMWTACDWPRTGLPHAWICSTLTGASLLPIAPHRVRTPARVNRHEPVGPPAPYYLGDLQVPAGRIPGTGSPAVSGPPPVPVCALAPLSPTQDGPRRSPAVGTGRTGAGLYQVWPDPVDPSR